MMGDFSGSEPSCIGKKRRRLRRLSESGIKNSDWRDWSGLPRNALLDIMNRLTNITDHVRFGAVCDYWRSILTEENILNDMCLLVSSLHRDDYNIVMYSLTRKRIYPFDLYLPESLCPKNFTTSRVSSLGWLVTMETQDYEDYNAYLQNPFLPHDGIVRLPPLDTIIQHHCDTKAQTDGFPAIYLKNAALSSDPLLCNEFTVVAIMNRFSGLVMYKSGDEYWTSIGDWQKEYEQHRHFEDVIYSRRTNQFYALRQDGEVLAINHVEGGEPNLVQLVPPVTTDELVALRGKDMYLVEDFFSGELFQVYKYHRYPIQAFGFFVFKLDRIDKSWRRVPNLEGKIMFLGLNESVVRSASDFPGYKPNCIYFTDDLFWLHDPHDRYGTALEGIYSFEKGEVVAYYSTPKAEKILAPAIWIQPTLLHARK